MNINLVPSLDRGWITATLCITVCQTTIFKGYRECRMLSQELFAKLHDANTSSQPTFLRISIGYRCVADSTTTYKIAVLCYKAVKLNNLRILLVYSRHTDSPRVLRSSASDLLSTQSSLTNIAARRFSCCAPPFGTVFLHLYALPTVLLVLGLSSRPTCSRHL